MSTQNTYTILGVYHEENYKSNSVSYSVAYTNHNNGETSWFKTYYDQQLVVDTGILQLLLKSCNFYGGSSLQQALIDWQYAKGVQWDKSPFAVEIKYEHEEIKNGGLTGIPKVTDYKVHVHAGEHIIQNPATDPVLSANKKNVISAETEFSQNAEMLPGVSEFVKHPSKYYDPNTCTQTSTVMNMIMHLNDMHKLTREQIADWLETLDVDLTFKSKEDTLAKGRKAKPDTYKSHIALANLQVKKVQESIKAENKKLEKLLATIDKCQIEIDKLTLEIDNE